MNVKSKQLKHFSQQLCKNEGKLQPLIEKLMRSNHIMACRARRAYYRIVYVALDHRRPMLRHMLGHVLRHVRLMWGAICA